MHKRGITKLSLFREILSYIGTKQIYNQIISSIGRIQGDIGYIPNYYPKQSKVNEDKIKHQNKKRHNNCSDKA